FDRRRGVPDSGFATSPYIGPLSGLAFNAGFRAASPFSGHAADPARLAARKLARALRAAGVRLAARPALGRAPDGAVTVAAARPPRPPPRPPRRLPPGAGAERAPRPPRPRRHHGRRRGGGERVRALARLRRAGRRRLRPHPRQPCLAPPGGGAAARDARRRG